MALINCPECKNEISDTSKNCPKCGYKIEKEHNKKKQQELINKGKNKLNEFINLLKKNKKKIIIALIVIIIIIGGYFAVIKVKDVIRENNRKDYPSQKELAKDIEKELKNELTQITINKKGITQEFKTSNIKEVKYDNQVYDSLEIKFYYHIEDSVSFDIPFSAYYSFDGKNYTYDGLRNNTDSGQEYKNVKITSCKDVTNDKEKNINDLVNEKYKESFTEIKLVEEKYKKDNICEYVYEAKKDGKYIKKVSKITATNTVSYSTTSEEFTVTSNVNIEDKEVKFDLVGKYSGKHEERGDYSNYKNSTFDFEITKVDGMSLTLTNNGKIYEGSSDTYIQTNPNSYIDSSDYEFYTFDIEFRWGSDGNGIKRTMQVRVYPDKLLYYCAYPKQNKTDGCYELTRK